MAVRESNSPFFTVLTTPPLEGVGWEVVVKSHADFATTIAVVGKFVSFVFSKELNGEGGGSVTLDLDDEIFKLPPPAGVISNMLDNECLWEFYYDGVLRHQFLGTKVEETLLDPDEERRGVTISGPGIARPLRWARVFPPGFPSITAFYWTFTNVSMMGQWLQLLNAAKARGTIPYVTALFTSTADSNGVNWTDSSSVQQENGATLYDLLTHHADIVGADWLMQPGFQLQAALTFGSHLESTIVFTEGSTNTVSKQRVRDRTSIANVVGAQDAFGAVSTAVDASSVTSWQRRELYVAAGNALDTPTRANVANAALLQSREEQSSWTIQVAPRPEGRVIFEDYDVGDWVGVERSLSDGSTTIDAWRVLVASISVDVDGYETLELTLQTKRELEEKRLQRIIDRIGGTGATVTAATPINVAASSAAAVGLAKLDDLSNVQVPSPSNGQVLYWDAPSSQWKSLTLFINTLADVDTSTISPANLDVLTWNSASGQWVPGPAASIGSNAGYGFAYGTLNRTYNFTSTVESWTAATGTLTQIAPGYLNYAITTGATSIALEPSGAGAIDDGEVVMDIRFGTASSSNGIVFRATDASNCYLLTIRTAGSASAGFELFKIVAGVSTSLGRGAFGSSSASMIGTSTFVRFLVRFVGAQIWLYADGTFVGSWNDSTWSAGRIGVALQTGSSNLQVDRVVAYDLPSTWNHSSIPSATEPGMVGPAAWADLEVWNSSSNYVSAAPTSIVTWGGQIWYALQDSTNVEPGTDDTVWLLAVAKGNDGTNGSIGSNGSPGVEPWAAGLPAWVSTDAYSAGPPASVVRYDGGSWLAVASSLNVVPGTDPTKWLPIALKGNDGTGAPGASTYTFSVTGTLTTVTAGGRRYNNTGATRTITTIQASVNTAPSGASIIIDVLKNGVSVFSSPAARLTISAGTNTATATPSTTNWASGEYIQIVIAQVGSSSAGADLVGEIVTT
jgi:hypothetical protein